MQSQAAWWIRQISAHMVDRAPIPLSFSLRPASEIELYPDAAGVNCNNPKLGCGAFIDLDQSIIFYMAWPDTICFNTEIPGCGRLGAKLSFLEGVAALCAILADPPSVIAKVITVHTDNLGLVLYPGSLALLPSQKTGTRQSQQHSSEMALQPLPHEDPWGHGVP